MLSSLGPGRRTGRRSAAATSRPRAPGPRGLLLAPCFVLILFLSLVPSVLGHAAAEPGRALAGGSGLPLLADNGSLRTITGGSPVWLNESVDPSASGTTSRVYSVVVTASRPLTGSQVELATNAIFQWAGPSQVPGGADSVPPPANWSWEVLHGGTNDSANWTMNATGWLFRTVPWQSQSFEVIGSPRLSARFLVQPSLPDATVPTAFGFVDSGPVPSSDAEYAAYAAALHPSLVRFSQTYAAPATWNAANASVSFALGSVGPLINMTQQIGAMAYVSIPAGTWGDGNLLPQGMPLNRSLPIDWTQANSIGYFPTTTAYATYLTTFAQAVKANGWNISYWNLGNEVPVANTSEASAFAVVFNAGARAIHGVFPSALVGSDVLLVKSKLGLFAQSMKGVGFIAFHAYPAEGLCTPVTVYCVPDNVNNYNRNAQVLAKTTNYSGFAVFEAPRSAQWAWYNATGKWLPIIDAETNLNSAQGDGTDPRQQTLFGAAWLAYSLIQAAKENVSNTVYYDFRTPYPNPPSTTSFYGGWGFGLTQAAPQGPDLRFAPYFAGQLWGSNFGRTDRGVSVEGGAPGYVAGYAARSGSNLSLWLVNLAGVRAQVTFDVSGTGWQVTHFGRLDGSTYSQTYTPTGGAVLTNGSGDRTVSGTAENGTMRCSIDGYGVLEINYTWSSGRSTSSSSSAPPVCPDGPSSGGGGGQGGGSGNNSSSSGNSTGSGAPGGPGGNGTGSGSLTGATRPPPAGPISPHGSRLGSVAASIWSMGGARPGMDLIRNVLPAAGMSGVFGAAALAGIVAGRPSPPPPVTDRRGTTRPRPRSAATSNATAGGLRPRATSRGPKGLRCSPTSGAALRSPNLPRFH
jgi:hypothetical protein